MKKTKSRWTPIFIEDRLWRYGEGYRPGVCERCGKQGLRFVHVVTCDDPENGKRVGACCADKMVGGYDAIGKQRRLKNLYVRLARIPVREWGTSWNGNQTIIIDGFRLTVFRNAKRPSRFSFCVDCDGRREYSKRSYESEFDAKLNAGWMLADVAGWFEDGSILDDEQHGPCDDYEEE